MPTVLALTEGSQKRPWASHSAGPNVACPVEKEVLEKAVLCAALCPARKPFTMEKKRPVLGPGRRPLAQLRALLLQLSQ